MIEKINPADILMGFYLKKLSIFILIIK